MTKTHDDHKAASTGTLNVIRNSISYMTSMKSRTNLAMKSFSINRTVLSNYTYVIL